MNGAPIRDNIVAAIEKRDRIISSLPSPTDAYRLIHSDGDGVPGITVDRLGPALLVEAHTASVDLDTVLKWFTEKYDMPIFLKCKYASEQNSKWGVQVAGGTVSPEIVVVEEGMKFRVNLTGGPHIGLFLDGRSVRRRVRGLADGKRVLNLFSYTGGFGVAAAIGGARSTTNVDQKRSALRGAKVNYQLNRLPVDGRTFLKSDAKAYLKKLIKQGYHCDVVILDPPPSAKRTNRAGFNTRGDYDRWVAMCLSVLSENGCLVAGLNNQKVSNEEFDEMIARGAMLANKTPKRVDSIPVDADFPLTPMRPTARFVHIKL